MNTEKMRYSVFGILMLCSILATITMASAAVTLINPTTGQGIKGSVNFNATTTLGDALNCTFATTQMGIFAKINNLSGSQTSFNVTNNTALFTQASGTTLNVSCHNATMQESTTITISIDNTAPVCAFGVDGDELEYLDPIGIATTQSSTDLTTLTYNWTLYDVSGTPQQTSASSAPTFSGTDFDEKGEFKLGLTVRDNASTSTACTNKSLFVRGDDTSNQVITQTVVDQETKGNGAIFLVIGLGVLIIFAGVGAFFITQSKKMR